MMANPYFNTDFFSFFGVLFLRLWGFVTGQIGIEQMVADEVQMAVLASVALSSALIGTWLVLRRMTMLANALSHTILLGIVLAFILTTAMQPEGTIRHFGHLNLEAMLFAAVVTGLATTFLTQFLTTKLRLQQDASVGLVFTSLFALGIVLVTLFTRNSHVSNEAIMGNVDALSREDLQLVLVILALNCVVVGLFYKEFKLTTFDPQLAQAMGVSATLFNYLLMLQVSITSIGAFRAVGVIMVLALITGPPLTARLLTHRLSSCLWLSMALGVAASVIGVALSRHLLSVYGTPLSTAGLVVCVIAAFFVLAVSRRAILHPKG